MSDYKNTNGRQVPMPELLLGHLLVRKQGQGHEHELILVLLLVQRRLLVGVLGQGHKDRQIHVSACLLLSSWLCLDRARNRYKKKGAGP